MYENFSKKGISPVIGVILMVSVTVALVALGTVTFFNTGGDVSESADATVQVSGTSEGLKATVLRNENVKELKLKVDGRTEPIGSDAGEVVTVDDVEGSYSVIGEMANGEEEVLDTGTVGPIIKDNGRKKKTVSGTVSADQVISGASVVSRNVSGEQIETTTTDENGKYNIEAFEGGTISVNVDGSVEVDGNSFYAGAQREFTGEEDEFNFNFNNRETTTVNGGEVTVSDSVEESSDNVQYISNLQQLQAMNDDLNADYKLIRDIDASETGSWNRGKGFKPIGPNYGGFSGSFDGQGYKIDGLTIDRSGNYVGLFGYSNGIIENVGLTDIDVTGGGEYIGGLIGYNDGEVSKSYATGDVSDNGDGSTVVGGLIGQNRQSDVTESYAKVTVSGNNVGGLIGYSNGQVSKSYATGDVNGRYSGIGGLVGSNGSGGDVTESYATGTVSGLSANVGGLVGKNRAGGGVTESYWDTETSGQNDSDGGEGLETDKMQGDDYDNNFENDIVDNNAFIGITGDYPELKWYE